MKNEIRLAEAVIALAVKEALHGTAKRREEALADIASGCLDYWVEVVCCEGYGPEALLDALHSLIVASGRAKMPAAS